MATLTKPARLRRRRASLVDAAAALAGALLAAERRHRARRALARALRDPHLARDVGLPSDTARTPATEAARIAGHRPL